MKLEILNDQYLIQVCNSFTNISVATKEDSDYQDYIPNLIAQEVQKMKKTDLKTIRENKILLNILAPISRY